MSRPASRVAIVDATPIVRLGLKAFLDSLPGMVAGFAAASPGEALRKVEEDPPDLILSEVTFPGNEGIFEFLRELRQAARPVPVLVFSNFDERLMATRVLQAGALGYVMKSAGEAELSFALEKVVAGHPHLSREMTDRTLNRLVEHPKNAAADDPVSELTNRELEVLELVGAGHTSKDIAEALHISLKTVETHRAHIRSKLGIDHGAGLISYASRWRTLAGADEPLHPPAAGI